MKRIILGVTISALVWGTASFAETGIHQRKQNQQARIGNGVRNGSLTAGETARLEHQESRLNREIRRDRRDGGGLSNRERVKINHQQNRLSREIRRDKHNGRTR